MRFPLLVVVNLLLLQTQASLAEDKTEFVPKNGMFTITLPAGEKESDLTKVLTIEKHRVPIESSRHVKDGTIFIGASIGIPAVVMRDIPAEKRFKILSDSLAKSFKGKVTNEKEIQLGDVPGREYTLEKNKKAMRMQLYTISGFVIFAIVEGTEEKVQSKEADAFFDSLKLTDEAKEVFGKVKR